MKSTLSLANLSGLFLIALTGVGQPSQFETSFEVASVRSSTHNSNLPGPLARMPVLGSMQGGPGTSDPERISFSGVSLVVLVTKAFDVGVRQISGPEWIDTRTYDIEAKVPAGATQEQFQTMLQNLLVERFGLVVHREIRDGWDSAYSLVLAKGGPKLKATIEPVGRSTVSQTQEDGRTIVTFRRYTLTAFAKWLRVPLANLHPGNGGQDFTYGAAQISDETGRQGEYDFKLEFNGKTRPGGARRELAFSVGDPRGQAFEGPDISAALEHQLGLRLIETKVPLTVLVVDRAEKVPTEN